MSKKNEISINELMGSQGGSKKAENSESKTKKASEGGWDDDDTENDNNGLFGSSSNKKDSTKKKTQKKENSSATWGQPKETQPVEEKPQEAPQQPAEKRRVMNKPGSKAAKPDVQVNQFDFPELGQEAAPKENEEVKQEQPKPVTGTVVQPTTSAPIKFQNAKKTTVGENFAKIETVPEKEVTKIEPKPVTTVQSDPQGIQRTGGFRRETKLEEKPVEEETGKFKFGGEGPVKFVKSDKSGKKEETKTKEDLLREQKEKEVEEKLLKEKEEARRQQEERKKREEANPHHKHHDGKPFKKHDDKPHEETKNNEHKEKRHIEKKEETNTNQNESKNEAPENKNGIKFSNSKKTQQAPKEQPTVEVAAPVETKEEAHETKEVVTKASTANWGEGLKKKEKKN